MRLISVGSEPAQSSTQAFVVAGAGLAEILLAIGIVAAARRSVHHGSQHPLTQIRQQRSDIQLLAYARLEILAILFRARILQIELFAAIGECADQRRKLERRDANAGTEARHARSATENRGPRRKEAGLLLGNVVAHALTKSKQLVILDQAIETELRAHRFKEFVVRVRHSLGEVHVAAIADADHGVARDHALLQSSERHERLDCGAGLETGGKRHLLINDG